MFKSFQDTSALQQFHGFPNLNMQQATSAYGFSGVTFWLDAAYGLNTQTNLGAVSRWQPRIGSSVMIQNTAGNQPRFILSDTNFNNLPSVEFFGYTARRMSVDGTILVNDKFTITCVYKNDALNIVNSIFSTTNAGVLIAAGTDATVSGYCLNNNRNLSGNNEGLVSYIATITNSTVHVNGSLIASGTTSLTQNITFLGGDFTISGSIIGRIAEIIIHNTELPTTSVIALQNNINQKYAIY